MLSWENTMPNLIVYENCNVKMENFLYKYFSLNAGNYINYCNRKIYYFNNLLDNLNVKNSYDNICSINTEIGRDNSKIGLDYIKNENNYGNKFITTPNIEYK